MRNSSTKRLGSPPASAGGTAQAPRRIGATSAAAATARGSGRGANTLRRPLASRASARDTWSIMRS